MVLQLEDVSKSFGQTKAVDHLTLHLSEGQILGLLGPNGAGKTTLMRLICGLTRPSSGRITLFDHYAPGENQARFLIGYMPQQVSLYSSLSTLENILFFGHLYGLNQDQIYARAKDLLEMLELDLKKHELAGHLSGGMRRRLMMATVLVHQPRLIIFDEPTAGVDPLLRIKFWDWFSEIVNQNASILITTHHISEASRCHKIAFIKQGHIFLKGSPQNLLHRYEATDLDEVYIKAIQQESVSHGN